MSNYSEKLKSPKWQKKRLEILNRDDFTCCKCGDKDTELHVHHLKYKVEPWDVPNEDLETLCKHCHKFLEFVVDILKRIPNVKCLNVRSVKQKDTLAMVANDEFCFFTQIIDDEVDLYTTISFNKSSAIFNLLTSENG